eukprot:1437063-Amphidinium_carterae.1
MPLDQACAAMRSCTEACDTRYLAWHRKQDHHKGLPNLFAVRTSNPVDLFTRVGHCIRRTRHPSSTTRAGENQH